MSCKLAAVALSGGSSEAGRTPCCAVCALEGAGIAVLSCGTGHSAGGTLEEVGDAIQSLAALAGIVGGTRGTHWVTGSALIVGGRVLARVAGRGTGIDTYLQVILSSTVLSTLSANGQCGSVAGLAPTRTLGAQRSRSVIVVRTVAEALIVQEEEVLRTCV